jgi:hypothetical protein
MADLENLSEEERNRLALFANRLLSDPSASKEVRRIAKKLDPKFQAPDIDLDDRINAVREEESAKRKELEDKLLADQLDRKREREHAKVRASGEDPEYIEKIMTDQRIGSYDTALKIAKLEKQTATPTSPQTRANMLPSGDDAKALWKNPRKWAQDQAYAEIDRIKRERLG